MLLTKVISQVRPCASVMRVSTRNKSIAEKAQRIKEIQRQFGVNDGVPVHLKAGQIDHLLYYTTCGLGVIGLVILGCNLYELAYPKKQ